MLDECECRIFILYFNIDLAQFKQKKLSKISGFNQNMKLIFV